MGEKTLITGASGFIGFNLAKVCRDEGAEVRCFLRQTSDTTLLKPLDPEYVYGDISDRAALSASLRGVSCVYHLAGITQQRRRGGFAAINTEGTRNLLEACAAQETPPRLVSISSLAASGPGKAGRPRRETDPLQPVSDYGRSKRDAERILFAGSNRVPCTIVRPPIVFGPGDRALLNLFRIIRRTGFHLVPGWSNPLFSFIHAGDLARLLLRIEKNGEILEQGSEISGRGIYFASGSEDVSFAEFGRRIGSSLERKRTRIFHGPPFLVLMVGLFNELTKPFFDAGSPLDWNKAQEALRGPWICSDEKAKNQFGFSPEKNLTERVAETTRWYQEYGWLRQS